MGTRPLLPSGVSGTLFSHAVRPCPCTCNAPLCWCHLPLSLPNLVTNLHNPRCAAAADGYKSGIARAIQMLSSLGTVYLDAGWSGWIGTYNAPKMASVMAEIFEMAGKTAARVRGFVTNVSNYGSAGAEAAYAAALRSSLVQAGHTQLAFIIDTGRNGGGQAPGWCNPKGAGMGTPPTASPGIAYADAFFWIKPPGESDGVSSRTAPRYDPECGKPSAWRDAPQAGEWFHDQFVELARHASPPLARLRTYMHERRPTPPPHPPEVPPRPPTSPPPPSPPMPYSDEEYFEMQQWNHLVSHSQTVKSAPPPMLKREEASPPAHMARKTRHHPAVTVISMAVICTIVGASLCKRLRSMWPKIESRRADSAASTIEPVVKSGLFVQAASSQIRSQSTQQPVQSSRRSAPRFATSASLAVHAQYAQVDQSHAGNEADEGESDATHLKAPCKGRILPPHVIQMARARCNQLARRGGGSGGGGGGGTSRPNCKQHTASEQASPRAHHARTRQQTEAIPAEDVLLEARDCYEKLRAMPQLQSINAKLKLDAVAAAGWYDE